MQAVIISDTSCLILMDKIQELDLLKSLFGQVLTTPVVAEEFGGVLPDWIQVKEPQDKKNQLVLETSLDRGEASAIALAMEQDNCLLIIDEMKGRKLARQLGLIITGTLGVIVEAKLSGHIPSVRPLLDKINQTNFRLSEGLRNAILERAGEQPL
jgi:predicted nucleic acid-binding protein